MMSDMKTLLRLIDLIRRPRQCDECGTFYPPTDLGGRITLCCSDPKGFYRGGDGLRHNGKLACRAWRSPITLRNPLGW